MNTPDWENIYDQYSGKVMGYIAARVQRRADAEDLCADVFEKAFRKKDAFDESKASISTWIFTITRNTVIDYFRRNKIMDEPDELQDIIVLMYYDGKPMTEVATLMGLSYGAVKLRHQKALAQLKLMMRSV